MKERVLTFGASAVAALLVAWATMGTALAAGGVEADGGFDADDIFKPIAIVAALLVAGGAAYMANRRRQRVMETE